ncbi:hypothetical protein GE21DRAFT_1126093 [Neurospora crassa]|nr:hypothetical protein GE21DRAFT_1126093 [Neurospora crassa]
MIPLLLACWICWLSRSLLSFSPTREVLNCCTHELITTRKLGSLAILWLLWLSVIWFPAISYTWGAGQRFSALQCLVRGDRRKERFLGHIRVLYPVFCGGRMYFFAPWSGFGSSSLAFYDPFFIYFPNMNFPWFCWVRLARTCLDNAPCSGLGYAFLKLDYPLGRRFSFCLPSLSCSRNLVLCLTIDVRVFFGPCSAPSSSYLPGWVQMYTCVDGDISRETTFFSFLEA